MKKAAAILCVLLLTGCGRTDAESAYAAAREALHAGELERAEAFAKDALQGDAERFGPLRAFIRGNVAFARSRAAEKDAEGGDTEAAKAAYKHAEDALAFWQWAAATRLDWPAARRNVERALLRLALLRERRRDSKKKPPKPPKPTDGEEAKPQPRSDLEEDDLPAHRVPGLFDVLGRRDREKIELRRAQRRTRQDRVENDW